MTAIIKRHSGRKRVLATVFKKYWQIHGFQTPGWRNTRKWHCRKIKEAVELILRMLILKVKRAFQSIWKSWPVAQTASYTGAPGNRLEEGPLSEDAFGGDALWRHACKEKEGQSPTVPQQPRPLPILQGALEPGWLSELGVPSEVGNPGPLCPALASWKWVTLGEALLCRQGQCPVKDDCEPSAVSIPSIQGGVSSSDRLLVMHRIPFIIY